MSAFSPSMTPDSQAAAVDAPVVLFDGVCNFCDGTVNFLMDRDPGRRLRFAALQSDAGGRLIRQFAIAGDPLESLILVEGGRAYLRSTAVLRALRHVRGPWRLASWLLAIPRFVRDPVYAFVARNRYRWFGTRKSCRMPTPADRERFLT